MRQECGAAELLREGVILRLGLGMASDDPSRDELLSCLRELAGLAH